MKRIVTYTNYASNVSKRMRDSVKLVEKEIIKQSNMIIDQEIKQLRQMKIPFRPVKKNNNKDPYYDGDGDVVMKCGKCEKPDTYCTCKK